MMKLSLTAKVFLPGKILKTITPELAPCTLFVADFVKQKCFSKNAVLAFDSLHETTNLP